MSPGLTSLLEHESGGGARRFAEVRRDVEEGILARILAERILEPRENLVEITGKVKAAGGVFRDLHRLAAGEGDVSTAWLLSAAEAERTSDAAADLMESLADDPRQGAQMTARDGAAFLSICRRISFDPAETPPLDRVGRPVPRLSLVWSNLPRETSIELTRVLAVVHRFDWRLRVPAQAGPWAQRASGFST